MMPQDIIDDSRVLVPQKVEEAQGPLECMPCRLAVLDVVQQFAEPFHIFAERIPLEGRVAGGAPVADDTLAHFALNHPTNVDSIFLPDCGNYSVDPDDVVDIVEVVERNGHVPDEIRRSGELLFDQTPEIVDEVNVVLKKIDVIAVNQMIMMQGVPSSKRGKTRIALNVDRKVARDYHVFHSSESPRLTVAEKNES
jgi:hypothetical protein